MFWNVIGFMFQKLTVLWVLCQPSPNRNLRPFHTGRKITAHMMLEEKIDDHHVFPQQYLAETTENVSPTLRDCVLNRTLIDKTTNIRIGKRAPHDYLREIEAAIGEVELESVLQSHLLPSGAEAPLVADDFEGFLTQRQELIAKQIESVAHTELAAMA